MSDFLLVPVHLDVLYLSDDEPVLEAMTDYRKLPYFDFDGETMQNTDAAYISNTVLSPPFENLNLTLKAGLHLHWALPDGLTTGESAEEGITFPNVPNRWAIARFKNGTVEKQWVVESDYLSPEGENIGGTVNIFQLPNTDEGTYQPFRLLGRNQTIEEWRNSTSESGKEYARGLSAIGATTQVSGLDNEKATFAAFYPNCKSVFGFHDPDYQEEALLQGIQYDVIGWYSDPQKDRLTVLQEEYQQIKQQDPNNEDTLLETLETKLGWKINEGQDLPSRSLYYSRITFNPGGSVSRSTRELSKPTIVVANTDIEALAAYLAHQLDNDPENRKIIEQQLEAIQLSEYLEAQQIDIGAKFQQVRHEQGFTPHTRGILWRVLPQDNASNPADATQEQAQISLPDAIADAIDILNEQQRNYEQAIATVKLIREQVYADWYKHMLALYDDPEHRLVDGDDIREWLAYDDVDAASYNQYGLYVLKQKIEETGSLLLNSDDRGEIVSAESPNSSLESLGARLAQAINNLITQVNEVNEFNASQTDSPRRNYIVKATPSSAFWRPNEPVILMIGDAVKPMSKHGRDGRLRLDDLLDCPILSADLDLETLPAATLENLKNKIDEIAASRTNQIGIQTWTEQSWNPFLLEWAVQLFPIQHNTEQPNGDYDPNALSENYQLSVQGADLSQKDSLENNIVEGANLYQGACILSPSTPSLFNNKLVSYLNQELMPDYYLDRETPADQQNDDFIVNYFADVKQWCEETHEGLPITIPRCTAIRAYEQLQGLDCLAQALGGFNDALITYIRTMQLDIQDPLAPSEGQYFHEDVRDTIARSDVPHSLLRAPQIFNDFNPLRAGFLDISGLRIIDTYGRVTEVVNLQNPDTTNLLVSQAMTPRSGSARPIYLPPRLAQPARLDFRWLSSRQYLHQTREMSDHPAGNPICGWILPNYFDNTLFIYDSWGKALGIVNARAEWQAIPGSNDAIEISEIESPYLRQMVTYLTQQGVDFCQDFITTIDTALATIDPDTYAQHKGLALLIGRPLALVRARVNLELLGPPAVSQNAEDLAVDAAWNENVPRTTKKLAQVKFPVRIGEYQQLNDGLVGYWIETADKAYQDNTFYAPQSCYVENPDIKTLYENASDPSPDTPVNIEQNLEPDTALTLALLIDPRGKVNATTGILPAKVAQIPPEQYASALEAIEVTFLSAPLLSDRTQLQVSLPPIPDYVWSWLFKEGDSWPESPSIDPYNLVAKFSNSQKIYEGWLKLSSPPSS